MNDEELLQHLESIAERLDLTVSYVEFSGADWRTSSGMCRVKDEHRILIDKRLPAQEQASAICKALSTFDLEGIYCPPRVRELIEDEGSSLKEERIHD
ncbi:hypothetical protein MYX64_02675 [Nitrospinae bacterium AH_259_B05_G02_I21]|nr:hypothetical protein [Nitrospinae bacterium AH_259_B05_G02_I21]MDA2931738.1 hypothetical protein [Nitrospinae bacterium AH-259-F20]